MDVSYDENNVYVDVDVDVDEEDEYIDMEVSASYSPPPPTNQTREFEFHKSSCYCNSRDTSPADELFYKGKLLPLYLPPCFPMVENLLVDNDTTFDQEFYSTPLMSTTPITSTTPYESCNISPIESCQVSRELSPDEYLEDYSTELSGGDHKLKNSWTKKLKLASKIKASRAYLRSFFGKSGCSDESCKVADEVLASKYMKNSTKIPFGQIQREKYCIKESSSGLHRRSFSLAFKRNSMKNISSSSGSNSSSSSTSSSSNGSNNDMQYLKRSNSSSSSEIESAIAYCKKSQQVMRPRKTLSEVGIFSLS
ncbi:hypothetical protein ACFE04_002462 [Oxalis oulophora]